MIKKVIGSRESFVEKRTSKFHINKAKNSREYNEDHENTKTERISSNQALAHIFKLCSIQLLVYRLHHLTKKSEIKHKV